jgi:hypothetical protein
MKDKYQSNQDIMLRLRLRPLIDDALRPRLPLSNSSGLAAPPAATFSTCVEIMVVGTAAGFHANETGRQYCNQLQQFGPRHIWAYQRGFASRIYAVQGKTFLARSIPTVTHGIRSRYD